jgi:hypothetical protein
VSETVVIHCRDLRPDDPRDIYIGRAVPRRGFKASPWANPFPIGSERDRAAVLEHFERWVRFSDDPKAVWIRAHLEELRGARLGCWCAPRYACHGGIYVVMLDERIWTP